MERPIRLHLGSGDKFWPGFVNYDPNYDDCDLLDTDLDYYVGKAVEVHAIHLFEHISRLEAPSALKRWHEYLVAGGLLVLEMPSLDKICQLHVDGERNPRLTTLGIFGDPNDPKPDMMHQWCYSNTELYALLKEAGFVEIEFKEPVYHKPERDLRVECRRDE